MTRARTIVFVAATFLVINACNRSSKPDPQAALDDAFRAGLLTKDEYDAKRGDIVAASAAASASVAAAVKAPVATAPNAAPAAPSLTASETGRSSSPPSPPTQPAATAAPGAKAAASTAVSAPKRPEPNEVAEDKITAPTTKEGPESSPDATHEITPAKEPAPAPLKGCEDEEFKSGGQKSESRFFAASPETVHRAAVSALESMDFNIRKNTGKEIEANKKRTDALRRYGARRRDDRDYGHGSGNQSRGRFEIKRGRRAALQKIAERRSYFWLM
jgi:hypothetical protein